MLLSYWKILGGVLSQEHPSTPESSGLCSYFSHAWTALPPYLFSSVAQSYLTLCNPMDCSTPGFLVRHQLQSLLKLMSIELVMPSNYLILCHSLLLLPSIFPSIRVFSNESVVCIRWPSIGASASASVLPMTIQDWLPLGLTVGGAYLLSSLWFLSKCYLLWKPSQNTLSEPVSSVPPSSYLALFLSHNAYYQRISQAMSPCDIIVSATSSVFPEWKLLRVGTCLVHHCISSS